MRERRARFDKSQLLWDFQQVVIANDLSPSPTSAHSIHVRRGLIDAPISPGRPPAALEPALCEA